MISFPANADIVVVHTPVSFGCGIDGMCRYCRIILTREPMDRAYFLFLNRSREQLRVLWYDGQGFSLTTKRLSAGTFRHWPKPGASAASVVSFFEAQALISGGDISKAGYHPLWKRVS